MFMKYGFDNEKYLQIQSEHIKERISKFGDKLYLEFGGKLFDDFHASRVLPGFMPDSKLKLLMQLSDVAEIAFSSLSQYICTIARSSIGSSPFHLYTQLLNLNLTPLFQLFVFSIFLILVNSGSVATVTGLSSVYPVSFLILPAWFHGCVLIFYQSLSQSLPL